MRDRNPDDYYPIRSFGRFFALYQLNERFIPEEDEKPDTLICVCVYKKGAEEVRRRLLEINSKRSQRPASEVHLDQTEVDHLSS